MKMDTKLPTDLDSAPFSVGGVLVEPDRNRITAPETTLVIERQVMVLLIYLANRAGQVVPRSELLETLWADSPTNDEALTQAVSKLRRALGDRGRERRIIETVRKVGYRLAVPVVPVVRAVPGVPVVPTVPAVHSEPPRPLQPAGSADRADRLRGSVGQRAAWLAIAAVGVLSIVNAALLLDRDNAETPRVFMMRAALAADSGSAQSYPIQQLDSIGWHTVGGLDSVRWRTTEGVDSARVATLLSELVSQFGSNPRKGIEPGNVTIRFQHVDEEVHVEAEVDD